jgi:FkbM family methyltransferase
MRAWAHGERELHLLSLLCEKQAVAVDVGASYGIYSYFLNKHSAGVVALEPLPECASFIRSALPAARVIEAAASDHVGTATLWVPIVPSDTCSPMLGLETSPATAGMRSLLVDLVTLDSSVLGRVGFIKIDVEGHELSVLNGALDIIDRDHPTILVEAEERHRPGAVGSVRELLEQRGYSGFFLFRGRIESIEGFNREMHQVEAALLRVGFAARADVEYVNNFIFVYPDTHPLAEQWRKEYSAQR